MNRRQFTKLIAFGSPFVGILGHWNASSAQDTTLTALQSVVDEIIYTNAWLKANTEQRYQKIRWGALFGAVLAQRFGSVDSDRERPQPLFLVNSLLPGDHREWVKARSPLLGFFVEQNFEQVKTAFSYLYDRHSAVYKHGLSSRGFQAESANTALLFSGAAVASMVGLVGARHQIRIPGLDLRNIADLSIADSLEIIGMHIYPC